MSKSGISENVKQFIFEKIDSVELLDVLLFIRNQKEKGWDSTLLAHELRSSANSVSTRLETLKRIGFLEDHSQEPSLYRYKKEQTVVDEQVLDELTEIYKIKRQKILELIFSPLKKGRHFADAFLVKPPKKNEEEDSNG